MFEKKISKNIIQIIIIIILSFSLNACSSSSSQDVPTLGATATPEVGEETLTDEEKVMAFTECLREQGFDFMDPVIDSDGNVHRPQLADGATVEREELRENFEICSVHLGELTFGKERDDSSERIDQFLVLASCLREADYDIDDPKAEDLQSWMAQFRQSFDFDDPDANEDYEACSEEAGIVGFGNQTGSGGGIPGSPSGTGSGGPGN